ncbi:hypothetical protein A3SI_15408 [Nitritalea halalkaliphila LW7]|uniref:Uncharacterized protein n=1 Tax=Nitritalea halalkaliphila LW7 TaxID=1189621 RepID=I5BYD3_9BACT|nr:hypothetical protein [Nitritalea halalkaliphila]EIM74585.1 hypothetical protein A3SI_15408 [Nitritalea halalkaliphila LW7]
MDDKNNINMSNLEIFSSVVIGLTIVGFGIYLVTRRRRNDLQDSTEALSPAIKSIIDNHFDNINNENKEKYKSSSIALDFRIKEWDKNYTVKADVYATFSDLKIPFDSWNQSTKYVKDLFSYRSQLVLDDSQVFEMYGRLKIIDGKFQALKEAEEEFGISKTHPEVYKRHLERLEAERNRLVKG